MTHPISRAGFLQLAALSASLLVIPKSAFADDNEITRDTKIESMAMIADLR